VQAKQNKESIPCFPWAGKCGSSHPKESRASSRVTVTWGDKCCHSKCLPLPSSPPRFIRCVTSYGMEHPWGQLSQPCPPLASCAPPASSLLGRREEQKIEKALTLRKRCSGITKTSLYYQHCFQHKSETQPHISYYEEN